MGALTFCVSFLMFFLTSFVAYKLCVIWVGEDNDSNI